VYTPPSFQLVEYPSRPLTVPTVVVTLTHEIGMYMVNWLRMWRRTTDSWITVKCPKKMDFNKACEWAEKEFAGWMGASGCIENPDDLLSENGKCEW
jgi:hypothetical protein